MQAQATFEHGNSKGKLSMDWGTPHHSFAGWQLRLLGALQGAQVMDYGSGSGVLALAALHGGAASAKATDVERVAVAVCAENADLNGFGSRMHSVLCSRDVEGEEPLAAGGDVSGGRGAFDVVVANILAGPLIGLAPRLAWYAAPGAAVALSGVLAGSQADGVVEAYSTFFDDMRVEREVCGWALITGTRKHSERE
mmetsp:Transcript_12213/g.36643  ORF Transcript_12213/g.36643 Transcript_12213/m.36643 type:complete len:196 (-) Transcript_12213:2539-3126(-)